MRSFIVVTLVMLFLPTLAMGTGTSLTWQKLALEEKVQRKFNTILSSALKDNQYLVEVETEITDPGAPNFGEGNKTGPKVSDLKLEESRGDYIAFSKMGLEVPVLDNFLDVEKTKLMNLYRFNEAYDVFKNITGVKVTVYLSDRIPSDLLEIVKKLVSNSKLAVSGIKPAIKFENIAMEWIDPEIAKREALAKAEKLAEKNRKPVQHEPKIWTKDWLEWASRWGNAVGLILGSLILGIMAFMLFKEWKAFMEKFVPKEQDKPDEKDEDEDEDEKDLIAQNEKDLEEEEMASLGFEKFQQCLEQHPEIAINAVKGWLNDSDESTLLALRGISQQASSVEMEKLMSGLTEQQRDKWKVMIGQHLEAQELKLANKHIFQEVIRAFLVPTRVKDGELFNLLMEIDVRTTSEFMSANVVQIGLMMNILSPSVVNRLLSIVDDNTADTWLLKGAEFEMRTLEEKIPLLKVAIKAYKDAHGPSPFAQRIIMMIPTASPSRESTLFRALAKAGNHDMVIDTAKLNFPSELVLDLPAAFLKEMMQSYPMQKRVELIYSRPEDIRSTLLDILAEAGTPARDMMDMELENIARETSRATALSNRGEEIWHEFVKFGRVCLSKNAGYASLAEQIIKDWSATLGGKLTRIKGGRAA
ncbi:MAG TPA: hypothetical protein VNJ08_02210 [Bacteriovoracaceae bacterium]|nr:hypothetical protein [Bacteriovoracaceae bacterium]